MKHLIECRCILPTLKKRDNPPLHKFVVFSKINNPDQVEEKFVSCNNCGILHKVYDLCRSEIVKNVEGTSASMTIDDIIMMLPESIGKILSQYERDLPDYEHALFMIEEEQKGEERGQEESSE